MKKTSKNGEKAGKRLFRLRWVAYILACLLILGGGWLVYAFSSGPVRVAWLGTIMAERASVGPAQLTVSEALVDFTGGEGMRIIVKDAHLNVAGHVPVDVTLPLVEAPVDVSALFKGQVQFHALSIDRPLVSIGLAGGNSALPAMDKLVEAVNRVSDVVDAEFGRRQLAHVEIRNGEVKIDGVFPRQFSGIDAHIRRDENRSIRARASVSGRVGPWRIDFLRQTPVDNPDRRIAILVENIALAEIVRTEAVPHPRRGLGIPLTVRFDSRLTGDGTFQSASLVGRSIQGMFHMGPTPIRFDDVALWLEWIGEDPTTHVRKSHVLKGETQLFFSGDIKPPESDAEDWRIRLRSEMARFGSADVPLPPFMLDNFSMSARFDAKNRTLFFDEASLAAGKAKGIFSGSMEIRKDGPYLAIVFDGEAIPIGLAKHVWPITLVPPARQWVLERIKTGTIDRLSVDASLRPPAFNKLDPDPGWSGDDLKVDMTFHGARVEPVGEVPEAYNLSGDLNVRNEVMTVRARDGLIYTGSGARVDVPEVTFQIRRLREKENKLGVVDVKMVGGAREIGRIFDSAPFKVLERADIRPNAISGEGHAQVHAEFPLRKQIDLATVKWQASAAASDFSLSEPVRGHTIGNADITVTANPQQVLFAGKGELDGLDADINLLLPLGGSSVAAQQGVVLSVTAAQLKEKDIDLTAFLDGEMVLVVGESGSDRVFDVDLTKATVRLDALGWSKAKGVPATATFRLVEKEDERQIQDFRLMSDGVDVSGSMTISLSGELLTASFSQFQLRAGDETSLSVQRSRNGRYKVAMVGNSFDARGLIRQVRKPEGSTSDSGFSSGMSVTASIDRVTGYNGVRLDDFSGMVETGKYGVTKVELNGEIDGREDFVFRLEPSGSASIASGSFGDAGATLKFLDLYERMRGGAGLLNVNMHDSKTWDGSFTVKNFSITEDPALKKLMADRRAFRDLDDDNGSRRVFSIASTGESSFDTLKMSFTRAGDILNIQRGALQGAAFGGTVSGAVNLKSQTMDLAGTFVPIFTLNNVFSKIPILGFALGGSSGEGLIGVTYRITGPISDPDLRVNPISAIAPGIFRRMFEFR
jgi:hypothetical protein